MKKKLALLLASIQLLGLCACKKINGNSADSSQSSSSTTSSDSSSGGDVVVDKDTALLYEGRTEYKVVIPQNADNSIINATKELNTFFNEATGISFQVVEDTGLTYNANDKYISIGNTSLLQGADIEMDNDELYRSGYIMKTQGNTYFLSGRTEELTQGNLYAVYDFLGEFLNYEYFAPGCYSLDKNVESLAGKQLDVVEIPDIAQRCLGYYSVIADTEYRQRMRLENYNDNSTWIVTGHSQTDIVNPKILGEEHPDWFSSDLGSVCLENEEMRAYLVEKLKAYIDASPEANVIHLGQADNDSVCSCSTCIEVRKTKYMNFSGQQIGFLNDISERLAPWLNEKYPGRDIIFTCFAYVYSEVAPCVWNDSTQKYEPFSEYVIPNDNVSIYWAPIRNDFSYTIDDPSCATNVPSYKAISAWHELLGDDAKIYMWSYCTDFMNYLVNFNNFSTLAENYKIYADMGVHYIFDQGPVNSGTPTFEELRVYLQSNLMWDTSLDVNELVEKFMRNYYGVAADNVNDYFQKLNAYYAGLQKNDNFVGTVYFTIGDSKYWPIGVLNSFAANLDDALAVVSNSKLKADEKEEYVDRINRLFFTLKYLYMLNYRGNFTNEQIRETVEFLEKYKEKYNIFNASEGQLLDSYLNSWRV